MVPQVEIEHSLIEIKKCKIDKLILNRKNETLCQENNEEIERLNKVIETNEKKLEEQLKLSGKKKIEVKLGYCSYRAMPDKFNYDIPKLINWAKEDVGRQERYVKVVEEFKKAQLKKDYAEGLPYSDDVCNEGLTITPQEPKFNYKLNGGL